MTADSRKWLALLVFLGAAQFIVHARRLDRQCRLFRVFAAGPALSPRQPPLGAERLYPPLRAGFLLLGGRVADQFGRRRVFMFGVALFSAGLVGL